jgi:MarR family transcriptional regulator, lower aerobic nicotinate degradation pathway regulator
MVHMPRNTFTLETSIYTHPGFLARRLQQIAVATFLEATAAFAMTPLQYGLLAVARALPGIDQIGAGDRLGLDRTTVVDIANRLEREVSSRDRRLRCLYLTAAGARRLRESTPAVERAQRRILDPLDNAERAMLQRAIARVVAHHNDGTRVPLSESAVRATRHYGGGGTPSRRRATKSSHKLSTQL